MGDESSAVGFVTGGLACPQANDSWAPAIALGTTRSTNNELESRRGEQALHITAGSRRNALGTRHVEQALHTTTNRAAGFTLAELLVAAGVVVVLVLLFTTLLNSAANITTLRHKQMDADSQAREILERMASDFAQMVKRPDVDYYLKSSSGAANDCGACNSQSGNDQASFYATVAGYYGTVPTPAPTYTTKSPVSLVSYRINSENSSSSCNRMERLGKGLAWNGFSSSWTPILFLPQTIAGNWASAVSSIAADSSYEVIGPQVFRFEYYYLLKNGTLSATPWYTASGVRGMRDVAAVVADIAVIDPKSKGLLGNAQIATLSGSLADYTGQAPGVLLSIWQNAIDANAVLPRAALSGIRVYERFLYLSPPTLGTP